MDDLQKSICKSCDKGFLTERQLHAHIKIHNLRLVEYYQLHYPKYDLFDGKLIKFKTKEQYLHTDFNSRENLKLWLKAQTIEESKKYCLNLLLKRKDKKELIYSPSQVEMKTVLMPPIQYYDEIFEDYYSFCESLGLLNKYEKPLNVNLENGYDNPNSCIYVDTREQLPLKFENYPTEIKTLNVGDYSFSDQDFTCNCYIERKSLADFISTLSVKNFERFEKEIVRAKEGGINLIILVEDSLKNAINFKYLSYISKKIKVTPEYVFHNVRYLIQKYPHIQFLFVRGRKESERVIKKIFFSNCLYKKVDLQYAYDLGIL